MNVYIDPTSWAYLNNGFFIKSEKDGEDDPRRAWCYLKEYAKGKGIDISTIDLWNASAARDDDVYVSLAQKTLLRSAFWKLTKDKRYPIFLDLKKFKKKILFQGEPPMAEPEAYRNIPGLIRAYDVVYFPFKYNHPKIGFYQIPFGRDTVPFIKESGNRKFLTIINANKSPRSMKKFILLLASGKGFKFWGYHELLSERIRAVSALGETGDIDLYGYDWDKHLPFPFWFSKKKVAKVYRGIAGIKLQKLSEYNFALAIENCSLPSHISEKMFDCFYAGTIPVYLGAPDIENHIPGNCFVNMRNFTNYAELGVFLKSLTQKQIEEYRQNARKFLQSERLKPFTKEYFADVFINAVLSD